MAEEFVIYADESEASGPFYGNFYGGCIVHSRELGRVVRTLEGRKVELNLHGEVKWQKVTANYLEKYKALLATFFSMVGEGAVRVRVMFTQRMYVPTGLTGDQRESAYFLLYYQFLKHAFGLPHATLPSGGARIRVYLDELPESFEKRARFRSYLAGLTQSPEFRRVDVRIDPNQIAEVDSRDHVLLQCTDVVLGAMQFRLNDKHKARPEGRARRGSRTIAKENLYKAILRHVQDMHPRFNIGITTGVRGDHANRWRDPYRHWIFVPTQHEVDRTRTKPKRK